MRFLRDWFGRARTATSPPDLGDLRRHNATRHLSAAAYLDVAYCDRIMREIYAQRRRWAAPSYGFDLITVLRNVRRAWWLSTGQALLLVAIMAGAAYFVLAAAILATAVLLIWSLVRVRVRISADFWLSLARPNPPEFYQQLDLRRRWTNRAIWFAIAMETAIYLYVVALHDDSTSTTRFVTDLLRTGLLLALLALTVMLSAVARSWFLAHLRRTTPGGMPSGRLAKLDAEQHHEVTVYSGPMPFIGSGLRLATWSFAQRLVEVPDPLDAIGRNLAQTAQPNGGGAGPEEPEVDREFKQAPFRTIDLVHDLEERLRGLRDERDPELRLPGLRVRHRVFVPGTESEWIPAHDEYGVSRRAIVNPSMPMRHYLACEVSSWGGEIYTTVYIHVSLQGRSLYVEFSTFVLPPTKEKYHVFDEAGRIGVKHAAIAAIGALWHLPASIARLPVEVSRAVRYIGTAVAGHTSSERAQMRGLDIGAKLSARELGADMRTHDWFQLRDAMKHWKIIERRMLAAILDFLEGHDVDVTEYRQRAIAVLDRSVINIGSGSVRVGAMGDRNIVGVSDSGGVV